MPCRYTTIDMASWSVGRLWCWHLITCNSPHGLLWYERSLAWILANQLVELTVGEHDASVLVAELCITTIISPSGGAGWYPLTLRTPSSILLVITHSYTSVLEMLIHSEWQKFDPHEGD